MSSFQVKQSNVISNRVNSLRWRSKQLLLEECGVLGLKVEDSILKGPMALGRIGGIIFLYPLSLESKLSFLGKHLKRPLNVFLKNNVPHINIII